MPDFRPNTGGPAGGLYALLDPYPRARGDRGSGIPTTTGRVVDTGPRVFLWSGHVRNGGTNVNGLARSRRVIGPAYIDTIDFLAALGAGSGNSPKVILGYSASEITEGNDRTDAQLAGIIPLVEQDFVDDGGFTAAGLDGIYQGSTTQALDRSFRLGRVIQAPEFFLYAAVRNDGGAGAFILDFLWRVLENVDPDLLGDLVLG